MSIIAINFHGPISHPATTKLRNVLCGANNESITAGPNAGQRAFSELYLLISSWGGPLDDAFALFGLLKSQRLKVTTVNTGKIASSAIIPFMAGEARVALPHARFHFHDYEWNYGAAHNMTRIEYIDHTQLLESAKQCTLSILKDRTLLTDDAIQNLQLLNMPIVKDAAFAKDNGIVHGIKDVAVTNTMTILNVDY